MKSKKAIQKVIQKASKSVIIIGVFASILGILALIYPAGFGKFSAVVIGVFLIIGGILRFTFAIVSYSIGSMLMRYVYALLMIIVGVCIIMNPNMGMEALTIMMAIYFIVDGITTIAYSFSLMPIGGGIYLLINGILGIVIGILIFSKWPESSTYAIGIYLGVKLLMDGLMLAATGNAVRRTT